MRARLLTASLLISTVASGVIIDRIAIEIGKSIIKDSDINRDIRVTSFLNNVPLSFATAARKEAANRLIDQIFIRREVNISGYDTATTEEAEQQLNQLEQQKYRSDAALEQALKRYGITKLDLVYQFRWQLTALRFIDARFKPAVLVSTEDVEKYYQQHAAALRRQYPGKSPDALRTEASNLLNGEQVNKLFFAWLDQQRKDHKIEYMEEGLR